MKAGVISVNHIAQVGTRLRQLRNQFRMTQRELAEGICSNTFVSKIESGHANPSLDVLQAFAQRLGVSLQDLLGAEETSLPPAWMVSAIKDIVNLLEAGHHARALRRALITLGRGLEIRGARDEALEAYRKAAEVT